MPQLAELVKARRSARNWSLRQLGTQIGVTPAYVADIEAGRRLPSSELKERLAAVLEIPMEELDAADSRLTPDLREWIEERPQLTVLLRSLRTMPESDMLIQRLSRLISRRSKPQAPRGFLVIWESELRAIAADANAWSVETGGDLFGRWHDVPTVLLATRQDQQHSGTTHIFGWTLNTCAGLVKPWPPIGPSGTSVTGTHTTDSVCLHQAAAIAVA